MNNYIFLKEMKLKSTPFIINNSSSFNDNLSQGSFSIKSKQENITQKFVANFHKDNDNKKTNNTKNSKQHGEI